jgi:AcrR family transcriptional regulator
LTGPVGQGGGYVLNEKFFELSKEKQDRILNAALKFFAANGYHLALTDEIARTAGISKGLLFHYFKNKQELLQYSYEYSVRFLREKMREKNVQAEKDFFRMMILTH